MCCTLSALHTEFTDYCCRLLISLEFCFKACALGVRVVQYIKLKFHWDQFLVTSSRTCWRCRQLPRNKLATRYEEVSDTPGHLDMSRWPESRQLPRNFLVTSWRHARHICYGEVTGKLVPVEFELNTGGKTFTSLFKSFIKFVQKL